jgi:hypothetical protein
VETTLLEGGFAGAIADPRAAYQQAIQAPFGAIVEREGREVEIANAHRVKGLAPLP